MCYAAKVNPTCEPYPKDCGGSGQPCCPFRYHNPTDKELPPRCANEATDWCDGTMCAANPPDCGEDGKTCCLSGGDVSTTCMCKGGLGLVSLGARTCGECPAGQHAVSFGSSVCTD